MNRTFANRHNFEFIEIPPFLAGSEIERLFAVCRQKLMGGKNILFFTITHQQPSDIIEKIRSLCLFASTQESACLIVDNVLVAKKAGAQGVLFQSCPDSYDRLREVLGTGMQLGRLVADTCEMKEVAKGAEAAQLDFYLLKNVQAIEPTHFAQVSSHFLKSAERMLA